MSVTFFTTLKPHEGIARIHQKNALLSWHELPICEKIIVFGGEKEFAELMQYSNKISIHSVRVNEFGTPLLNDMFYRCKLLSNSKYLCYINSDIILMYDFEIAMQIIINDMQDQFLMIGQRTNVVWDYDIDFGDDDWEQRLIEAAQKGEKLHFSGIDYFVFHRDAYSEILPFAIGRTVWDNWLVYKALKESYRIIDVTLQVAALHQIHDYSHHGKKFEWYWHGPEAQLNQDIVAKLEVDFIYANVASSSYVLKDNRIVEVNSIQTCYDSDLLEKIVNMWITKAEDRNICFFGASKDVAVLKSWLSKKNIEVMCIFDNDEQKNGDMIYGIPVISPNLINKEMQYIIITSAFAEEIGKQLEEKGLILFHDFTAVELHRYPIGNVARAASSEKNLPLWREIRGIDIDYFR